MIDPTIRALFHEFPWSQASEKDKRNYLPFLNPIPRQPVVIIKENTWNEILFTSRIIYKYKKFNKRTENKTQ